MFQFLQGISIQYGISIEPKMGNENDPAERRDQLTRQLTAGVAHILPR